MTDIAHKEIIESIKSALNKTESVEDMVWKTVDEIVSLLKYDDCVIYLYDERKKALIQRAASGAKRKADQDIKSPIRIEPGEGIVGRVFQFGMSRIIADTTSDANYIIDDRFRLSEISVPIFRDEKVIGVIDSEHPSENFYSQADLAVLTEVAVIISDRIVALEG